MRKITLKSRKEILLLRKSGQILAEVLFELSKLAQLALQKKVTTWQLEEKARELIYQKKAKPSFLGYKVDNKVFPAALCVSLNDEIVHGIPKKERELKEGDLLKLDLGVNYKGFFTDSAVTLIIGQEDEQKKKLKKVCEECLMEGIRELISGNSLNKFGKIVERIVQKKGLSVIKGLVGHGVGYSVHEPPQVFNFDFPPNEKIILREGMVLAPEPMITNGCGEIELAEDGFTYKTQDGALAAHFEHTIAITSKGNQILTKID